MHAQRANHANSAPGGHWPAHPHTKRVTYDYVVDTALQESTPSIEAQPDRRPASHQHPRPGFTSIRSWWVGISIPFWIAASRIALGVVFAHLVIVLLPQSRQHLPGATLNNGTWLGAFDRWDSAYYLDIAQHGYPAHAAAQTVFFPGYPLLISLVHGVTFGTLSYLHSALAVSWLAFTAAAVVLYRLATKLYGQRVGLIATGLFCWFPATLFFMSPYSEALFAFEIVAVLALLERRSFLAAALVAGYASATSPESIGLTLALMAGVVLAGKGIKWALAYGAVSGIGLFGYMMFLWAQYGRPFEFISEQKRWMRSEHFPFVGLYRNILALRHWPGSGQPFGGTIPTLTNFRWVWLLDDAALVVGSLLVLALVAMCVARWKSHSAPPTLGSETGPIPLPLVVVTFVIVLLAACTTIAPFAGPTWASSEGQARFISVVMPLYVAGALVVRRHTALICFAVGGSVIVALILQAMYNLGYWVT
jgi:hypothetical protein